MHVFVDTAPRRPCLQQRSPRRRHADLRSTYHPPSHPQSSPRCRGHSLIRCARSGCHAHKSGISSQNERQTDVRPARASGASSEQAKVPRSASTFGVTIPSGSGSRRKRPTAASPPQPPRASTGRSLRAHRTPFPSGLAPLLWQAPRQLPSPRVSATVAGRGRSRPTVATSGRGSVRGARGRRVSRRARSWRPGELGAGAPRAAQLTHVWGPCVDRVRTAGRVCTCFLSIVSLVRVCRASVPSEDTDICGHNVCCRSPKPYR